MILIDLQKAFDTIDHILLLKMSLLEFSREVFDWYKSYLSSRNFHVNVHDKLQTLPLPIYDAEFPKDPFLDLCYFCCT